MSNYKNTFNFDNENSSWGLAFKLIEDRSRVLEIGCGNGNFAEALRDYKQCSVTGIEPDAGDAKLAATKLDEIHVGTVEQEISKLTKGEYDYIVFLDVLEHLIDPIETLSQLKPYLKKSGSIVFSLPNMAHISIRIMLLGGSFDYGETGILDKTHLHFYVRNEIERIFRSAGYSIDKLSGVVEDYTDEMVRSALSRIGVEGKTGNLSTVLRSNHGEIYQYVGSAQKKKITMIKQRLAECSPNVKKVRDAAYEQEIERLKKRISDLELQASD